MEYIQNKNAFYRYIYQNCHCVNAGQSLEERRFKYAIVRSFGKSRSEANRLRDWRSNNFAKHYGYSNWENLLKFIKEN